MVFLIIVLVIVALVTAHLDNKLRISEQDYRDGKLDSNLPLNIARIKADCPPVKGGLHDWQYIDGGKMRCSKCQYTIGGGSTGRESNDNY